MNFSVGKLFCSNARSFKWDAACLLPKKDHESLTRNVQNPHRSKQAATNGPKRHWHENTGKMHRQGGYVFHVTITTMVSVPTAGIALAVRWPLNLVGMSRYWTIKNRQLRSSQRKFLLIAAGIIRFVACTTN